VAGFVWPCLPVSAPKPPSGEDWLHEIKQDGFRVIARKTGKRVKLYSRPGDDLTYRFLAAKEAPARLQGELAPCGHAHGGVGWWGEGAPAPLTSR
jgi:ATP-dependent DNA ligase